jgi:type II secretory pathway component PulJ
MKTSSLYGGCSSKRSFTLLEMLTATTLLIILTGLLFRVTSDATSIATFATEQMDTNRTGRECLDLIGREITKAALPWNRSATNLQFLINPAGLATMDCNPDTIFWQAPVSHSTSYGNLAIVGYLVLRDFSSTDKKNSRLQLRRIYVEPENPSSTTYYTIYNSTATWVTQSLVSNFAPSTATLDNSNAQKGWVADGVIGIWVRCLDKSGNPITADATGTTFTNPGFDSRAGYTYQSGSYKYATNYSVLPSSIEVALLCVSSKEIQRIQTLPVVPATDVNNFYSTINTYAQTLQNGNPAVKSFNVYSRKFRLYNND